MWGTGEMLWNARLALGTGRPGFGYWIALLLCGLGSADSTVGHGSPPPGRGVGHGCFQCVWLPSTKEAGTRSPLLSLVCPGCTVPWGHRAGLLSSLLPLAWWRSNLEFFCFTDGAFKTRVVPGPGPW